MEKRFNLLDEKWIPLHGGEKISLLDAFSPNTEGLISGNSIQKISIYKFLFAIGQAAISFPSTASWLSIGTEEFGKKCREYLIKNKDCFWLYGEKPFLQYPCVETPLEPSDSNKDSDTEKSEKTADIKKYDIGISYMPDVPGNNESVLTEFQTYPAQDDAEKAVFLLGISSYALSSKRVTLPETYHEDPCDRGKSGSSSPSIGNSNGGYQHSFLMGPDILTTIYLNQFTEEEIKAIGCLNDKILPPWEEVPPFKDCKERNDYKDSLWAWYFPMTRATLLIEGKIIYAEGVVYKKPTSDPFLSSRMRTITVEGEKKEIKDVLYVDTARKPWRTFPSLMEEKLSTTDKENDYSCLAIKTHIKRTQILFSEFSIWAGGLALKGTIGEQFVRQRDDFVESYQEFLKEDLGEKYYLNYRSIIDSVMSGEGLLSERISKYYKSLGFDKSKNMANNAIFNYWRRMDGMSNSFVRSATDSESVKKAKAKILHAVCEIYDLFCPHGSPRQLFSWQKYRPVSYKRQEGENEMNKMTKQMENANNYVKYVYRRKNEDTHFRAVMKRADDEKSCMDSWSIIGKFVPDLTKPYMRDAYALVGAAIARSTETENGNVHFGRAFYLASAGETGKSKEEFPSRFSKVMRCMSSLELIKELRFILPYFASKSIHIDYAELLCDLLDFRFGEYAILQVKAKWANDFNSSKEKETENVSK